MRKVIFQKMVSLDGYFEGANHEIDWHVVDDEFNQYAIVCEASRPLVFDTFTNPNLIPQWWGPVQYITPVDKFELKPAGLWRFV